MSKDRSKRAGSEDEAPSRSVLHRAAIVAFWMIGPVLLLAFLVMRAWLDASAVSAELDERIDAIREEIRVAQAAEGNLEALDGEIAAAEAERSTLDRRMPCAPDLPALLSDIKSRVEPLGVTLQDAAGFARSRMKDWYTEVPLFVVLPDRAGAEDEVRAALRSSEVLLAVFNPRHDRVAWIVVFQWRGDDCPPGLPSLREHRGAIGAREGLLWPFDRGVMRRDLLLERLRKERAHHASALQRWMYLQRLRDGNQRFTGVLVTLERKAAGLPAAPP